MGRKPGLSGQWWTVVDSQCVPEDPEMSRQSSKWFMARPPTVQSVDTVQQPVDILRSVSAPLFQRYLDLSGSDIWSIIQVRQFLISPDISWRPENTSLVSIGPVL